MEKIEDYWYPVIPSKSVNINRPQKVTLLNQPLMIFRDREGVLHCFLNVCPHQCLPLSEANIGGGIVKCNFHGWEFNYDGKCLNVPGLQGALPDYHATTYPVIEQSGFIWVCIGNREKAGEQVIVPDIPQNNYRCAQLKQHFNSHYSLLIQNLCDPAHFYLHRDSVNRFFKLPNFSLEKIYLNPENQLICECLFYVPGGESHFWEFKLLGPCHFVGQGIVIGSRGAYSTVYGITAPEDVEYSTLLIVVDTKYSQGKFLSFIQAQIFKFLLIKTFGEDERAIGLQQQRFMAGYKPTAATAQDQLIYRYHNWRKGFSDPLPPFSITRPR